MNKGVINEQWELFLPDDRIAFHGDTRPNWERGRLEHLYERVEPGMTILEAGSESGDFTSLMQLWTGPTGTVVPIEPQPAYWPSIRKTWEANGFAPPKAWFPGFAARETLLDPFRRFLAREGWPVKSWPVRSSKGPIVPDAGFFHVSAHADRIPSIRLDDLVDTYALVPNIVVLDIEGAEWDALEGSRNLMAQHHPLLYVSLHIETLWNWYQRKPEHIHELMAEFGYTGTLLPHHGEGEDFWFYES